MEAAQFTNMVAGHNRFSVVAEHNSFLTCKTVATVSPREGYPELPDLSDNPLPYCTLELSYRVIQWKESYKNC